MVVEQREKSCFDFKQAMCMFYKPNYTTYDYLRFSCRCKQNECISKPNLLNHNDVMTLNAFRSTCLVILSFFLFWYKLEQAVVQIVE